MDSRFRNRLLALHVAILLILVLAVTATWMTTWTSSAHAERARQIGRRLSAIEELRANARELARSTRRHLIMGDPEERQRVRALERDLAETRARVVLRDEALERAFDHYVARVVRGLQADADRTGGALARFEDELMLVRGPLATSFDDHVTRLHAELDAIHDERQLVSRTRLVALVLAGLGIALVIGAASAVLRHVRRLSERLRAAEAAHRRLPVPATEPTYLR